MDSSFTAQECFERGRALLAGGDRAAALEHLRAAHELEPARARFRSYYGLALALVERRFDRALELCQGAAKEEFFNPELYHNLARVHLAFGFKAEGIRFLRRGLMLDPAHGPILDEMARLGVRRDPVLRFLPRNHALNRLLGRLRGGTHERMPAEGAGAQAG